MSPGYRMGFDWIKVDMAVFIILVIFTVQQPITIAQGSQLTCPQGWFEIYSKCYLPIPWLRFPWDQASKQCQKYGGELVKPTGTWLTEEIRVLATGADNTTNSIWTGYHRDDFSLDDTIGYWSDGSLATVDVGDWGYNEPNIQAGKCAAVSKRNNRWNWFMELCEQPKSVVCEALPCPKGMFRCDTGRCISYDLSCNGIDNCGDLSDERNCSLNCSYYILAMQGEIVFPTSGLSYLNQQTCQWVIEGSIGSRIQIQIIHFSTEHNVDFLEIWGGGRTVISSTRMLRLSGTLDEALSSSSVLLTPNSLAILRFFSDTTTPGSGFRLYFQSGFVCDMVRVPGRAVVIGEGPLGDISDLTETDCYSKCMLAPTCVAVRYDEEVKSCCQLDFMPSTTFHDAAAGDNLKLYIKTCPGTAGKQALSDVPIQGPSLFATATPKRLFSPLYPFNYPSDYTYMWTISSPGQHLVSVQILDWDVGTYDYISFYDGPTLNSDLLLTLTSGGVHNKVITSTGNSMLIYFKSFKYSRAKRGFLLSYRSGCQYEEIINLKHEIESPGFGVSAYPNVMHCEWSFSTVQGRTLALTFEEFHLEADKDFVEVYKDSDLPVHTGQGFTGQTTPSVVLSQVGRIKLVMKTGATGRNKGFKATLIGGCAAIDVSSVVLSPSMPVFFGDTRNIKCQDDFVFNTPYVGKESVNVTCQMNGQWDKEIPACKKVLCGRIPAVVNGYITNLSSVFSGDKLEFQCFTGFKPNSENGLSRCFKTGEWSPLPLCLSARVCPALVVSSYASMTLLAGNGTDHGSVVHFGCSLPGFELIGPAAIACSHGNWSHPLPLCQRIKCGAPYIRHATTFPSSNISQGDPITVSCLPGFQLEGPETILCGMTDQLPICENIDECASGVTGCNQTCTDDIGSFRCSCGLGYRLAPDGRSCEDMDECSANNGHCEQVCTNTVGSYVCSCPYLNATLFQQNGQSGIFTPPPETGLNHWNKHYLNHTCLEPSEIFCPSLPITIVNGQCVIDKPRHSVGDSLLCLCNLGFEPARPSILTCLGTGQWDGVPPSCRAAHCDPPDSTASTTNPTSGVAYLGYFSVSCTVPRRGSVDLWSRCVYESNRNSYLVDVTELTCPQAVDCGTPIQLPGSDSYSVTSTVYGSTFTFHCRNPYFNIGGLSSLGRNSEVTCMADGHWDFGDLRCLEPSCTDPGTKPGAVQIATSYEEYSLVYYRCERSGFEPQDKRPLECQWNSSSHRLQWNGTAPECVDVEPPRFTACGVPVIVVPKLTAPGISDPTAYDNVLVTSLIRFPINHSMRQIVSSDLTVMYQADDAAGNVANCTIEIRIRDEDPPTLECVPSFVLTLQNSSDIRSIDLTQFIVYLSESSSEINISYSPSQLTVDRSSVGEVYTVVILVADSSGNSDFCLVQVKVEAPPCADWSLHVEHGETRCSPTPLGLSCLASCLPGYSIYENPQLTSVNVTCTISDSSWSRTAPICVAQRDGPYQQSFQLQYSFGSVLNQTCRDIYLSQLQSSLPQLVKNINAMCSVTSPATFVSISPASVIISLLGSTVTASIAITLQASQGSTNVQTSAAVGQCADLTQNAFAGRMEATQPVIRLYPDGLCPGSGLATYIQTLQNGNVCDANEEKHDVSFKPTTCLACPPGYFSQHGAKCSPCPSGTYFNTQQANCTTCPGDTRWMNTGARSLMDCYLTCPYGYTSPSGQAVCRICPRNSYSSDLQTCSPCPAGKFNSRQGEGTILSCRDACHAGYFSKDGMASCEVCPKGFYQGGSQAQTCLECDSDHTTENVPATSVGDCKPGTSLCDQTTCLNGGTCQVVRHEYFCICLEGYAGERCEMHLDPCSSQPCLNHGKCVVTGETSFRCDCPYPHVTGLYCQDNNNQICNNNPCSNNGSCQTGLANFTCLCPSYIIYTQQGDNLATGCNIQREPCRDNPCRNGGTCESFGRTRRLCKCLTGFTGDSCETDIDSCLSMPCKNNGSCTDLKGDVFTCMCPPGFTGNLCDVRVSRCLSSTCMPSAYCVDNYLNNQVSCVCQEGYKKDAGGNCVEDMTCQPNPCQNGGTCLKDGQLLWCACAEGYEGANCQHNINDCDPDPCQNGGACLDLEPVPSSGNKFTCQCNNDTYGDVCLDSQDICQEELNPCNKNHSQCLDLYRDYICLCDQGYYGQNCTESSNLLCKSFPCQHGGTCLESHDSFACQCASGYAGPVCASTVDHCTPESCLNGATCFSHDQGYSCKCAPGYHGDQCQAKSNLCNIIDPCQGDGSSCNDSLGSITCSCGAGYAGDYCQDRVCLPTSCENLGTCVTSASGIMCICSPGYEGARCELRSEECVNENCPDGATCVSGSEGLKCQCLDGRFGDSCKVISPEFDIILHPTPAYDNADYEKMVELISSQSLSISTWVRSTNLLNTGVVLSLYGLETTENFTNPSELFVLEISHITVGSSPQITLNFNTALNDGLWHHLVLTWNATKDQLTFFVDGDELKSLDNVTSQLYWKTYAWLILGGTYNSSTGSVDHTNSITGRISRVYVTNTVLSESQVHQLWANITVVPERVLFGFLKTMAQGTTAAVDYWSELSLDVCRSRVNCSNFNNITSTAKFLSCPSDQLFVSERVSSPVWYLPAAAEPSTTFVNATLMSGATVMGWGVYGVAYTNFDYNGIADMCAFRIVNRRTPCLHPQVQEFQSQTCVQLDKSILCTMQCSNSLRPSAEAPKYFSCGTYGMYGVQERILPFTYQPCSSCTPPPRDYTVRLNYTSSKWTQCTSPSWLDKHAVLQAALLGSLTALKVTWPDLCAKADCSELTVEVDCSEMYGITVELLLPSLGSYLHKLDASATSSVEDVLTTAIVDDNAFTYVGVATPDVQSLVILGTDNCPTGTILIGDCCSECPVGKFYNIELDDCAACPKGFYLDTNGLSGTWGTNPCRQCPSGQTTSQEGATSVHQCLTSCPMGKYYNLNTGQCVDCPMGFYSERSGEFYCEACLQTQSTPGAGSTSRLLCSEGNTTEMGASTSADSPSVGAVMTQQESKLVQNLLIVLVVVLLVVVIVLFILFCCLRPWLEKHCTCLINKVTPEGQTKWHHVNKYGETKIKFVSHSMKKHVSGDRQQLLLTKDMTISSVMTFEASSAPEGQPPLLPENNGKEGENEEMWIPSEGDGVPISLPPLKTQAMTPPVATWEGSRLKQPPSAFNKPKPRLDQVPFDAFVQPKKLATLPGSPSKDAYIVEEL